MAGFTLQDVIDFAESNKQIKKSGGRIYNEGNWYIGNATRKWNGTYKTNIMEML